MKRKALTTALLAGITGVAGVTSVSNAVNLNPDGLGQVLIYPFYTVNDGNQTLISVVNTTAEAKAVKVRVLEGMNSREVLDFNLYLSEFDVWTANISEDGTTDGGNLRTNDTSCTVPNIVDDFPDGVPFRDFGYVGVNNDGETESIRRTREGYIEMIEMGVVTNATEGSAAAATHVGPLGGEAPSDCVQLEDAWFSGGAAGYWAANPLIDMDPPSGGLFGGGYILDVQGGTSAGYNATALDRHSSIINHTRPDSTQPTIASADTAGNVFAVNSIVFDNEVDRDTDGDGFPDNGIILTTWTANPGAGEDAVSAVLMRNQLFNEFVVSDSINADTEFVITFPTKRFYVDFAVTARPPFTEVFDEGGACEDVGLVIYNREESPITIRTDDFSPPRPAAPGPQLCWEANVIAWDQGLAAQDISDASADRTEILGSANWSNVALPSGFSEGWATLSFPNNATDPLINTNAQGHAYSGLPALGFAVVEFANGTLSGGSVLSNYDSLFDHRATRDVCVTGCS